VVLRQAKRDCPVDQGPLRAETAADVREEGGDIIGTVYNPLDYAPYVHQGTGVFAVDGNGRKSPWIYKTQSGNFVRTVGNKPQPFIKNAMEASLSQIAEILSRGR